MTDTPRADAFTTSIYNDGCAAQSDLPGYGGKDRSPEECYGLAVELAKTLERELWLAEKALGDIYDALDHGPEGPTTAVEKIEALKRGISEASQLLEACAPYLKDDETPAQRIERERRESDGLITLLAQEKRRVAEKDAYAGRLAEALRPFAHDDLCRQLGGNEQGDASPVFQRITAWLTLGDFRRARAALADVPAQGVLPVCPRCKGAGSIEVQERIAGSADEFETVEVDCPECKGSGAPPDAPTGFKHRWCPTRRMNCTSFECTQPDRCVWEKR